MIRKDYSPLFLLITVLILVLCAQPATKAMVAGLDFVAGTDYLRWYDPDNTAFPNFIGYQNVARIDSNVVHTVGAKQLPGVTDGETRLLLQVKNNLDFEGNLQLGIHDNGHPVEGNRTVAQFGGLGGGTGGVLITNFINPLTPTPSTALEIRTTQGAVLLSRLTNRERNALTAQDGMIIYNRVARKFQGRADGVWVNLH